MRFTKEKYPLLVKNHVGAPGSLFNEVHTLIFDKPSIKNNVFYVCNTFMEDSVHNFDKIKDLSITPGIYVLLHGFITILVEVEHYENINNYNILVSSFQGDQLLSLVELSDSRWELFLAHNELRKIKSDDFIITTSAYYLAAILFKQHAEIKTKICPPKSKVDLIHCKYKSDIDIKVNILDLAWYTECIQANSFWVRGHWRSQVCGEKRKSRKIIWVKLHESKRYIKGPLKNRDNKQRINKRAIP